MNMRNNKFGAKRRGSKPVISLIFLYLISIVVFMQSAMAHCPLCTVGTIAGVGITRSLGLDDSIVGIFVGAMIVSSALWLNRIFKNKNIGGHNGLRFVSLLILTIVLTLLTFYLAGLFGIGNNYRIFGIERLTFGAISGGIVSLAAFNVSNEIKKRNKNKTLFNYQTISITFLALILNAVIFWRLF